MKLIYFIVLMTMFTKGTLVFAGGGSGSHGGDTLVAEFAGTTQLLGVQLNSKNYPGCLPTSRWEPKVELTDIKSEILVYITNDQGINQEEDAENYYVAAASNPSLAVLPIEVQKKECRRLPLDIRIQKCEPHINISRSRLIEITDPKLYLTLVLHEWYGLNDIEKTNDTRVSSACIQSLSDHGVELKTLVYHEAVVTSIERLFANGDGRFYFDCKNDSDRFRIYNEYSPALRKRLKENNQGYLASDFYQFNIEHDSMSGKFMKLALLRSPTMTPEGALEMFSHEYSISEGIGRIFYRINLSSAGHLTLSTEDHATWRAKFVSASRVKSFEATCTPEISKRLGE